MAANAKIYNKHGVLILGGPRNLLALLGKRSNTGSAPTGTLVTAYSANGSLLYDFGLSEHLPESSYGMKIWHPTTRELLFDAVSCGGKMARPIATLSGRIPNPPVQGPPPTGSVSDSDTVTVPTGRTYAVAYTLTPSALYVRNVYHPGTGTYQYALDDQTMAWSISGSQLTVTATRTYSSQLNGRFSQLPYNGDASTAFIATAIDVTGF